MAVQLARSPQHIGSMVFKSYALDVSEKSFAQENEVAGFAQYQACLNGSVSAVMIDKEYCRLCREIADSDSCRACSIRRIGIPVCAMLRITSWQTSWLRLFVW